MQKPDFTMSIAQVFPGETIPPALLFKLHSENQSAQGFAVQDNGKLVVEKFTEMNKVETDVKETAGILETTLKHYRMMCFSAFPDKFDPAEVQPWIILKNSKDEPILVVACEGDFPGRSVEGHSDFYGLVHEYLGPKIEGLFKLLGNDPKKLAEFMGSKEFHADLDNVFAHRAVFEFMFAEGAPITYGKNEIGGEYTWGRASNIYGYTESVQEAATPAKAEPEKKRSKYSADTPDTVLPPGVQRVPDKPPVEVPKADPKPVEKAVSAAADAAVEGHWEDIPGNLHGKRKKSYIRGLLNGELPVDWDNLKKVFVKHQGTVNSLADLNKTAAGAIKDMKGDITNIKQETMPLPVISGPQQAGMTAFIKKYLDGNSNRVENPLEIQKIEAKLPVFTELAPAPIISLDDLDNVASNVFLLLVKEHPESAWLLMLEYRSDRRKRKTMMLQGDKKLSDLTGTEVDPSKTGTTEPASPAPGTASPPETPVEAPFKKSKYA